MASLQDSSASQFDDSPADSFISTPGDNFSSLFPSGSATIDPVDMLTPRSSDDRNSSPCEDDMLVDIKTEEGESTPGSTEKKTKKRKSWGQVLPEPKTNLPPRKRAKTDDEKEQRRVERVLRNRRAAQSSRERKRLEVEALEKRNEELEAKLREAQKTNLMMFEQIQALQKSSGMATASNPLLDSMRDNVAFSQSLFGSQDGYHNKAGLSNPTVNPASLSPELAPVSDLSNPPKNLTKSENESKSEPSQEAALSIPSPDVTQHPAEMLSDLPCHMLAEAMPRASLSPVSTSTPQPLLVQLAWLLSFQTFLHSASAILSACQRPLMQIAMSSKAGFSLRPTPQLLTTIIWLVTLPPAESSTETISSSTSMTSSPPKQQEERPRNLWQRALATMTSSPAVPTQRTTGSTTRSTTLRLTSLRKILSSSPNLARPLTDATMVALRLVSEGRKDQVGTTVGFAAGATRDSAVGDSKSESQFDRELIELFKASPLPSWEVLVTLLWGIKASERRIQKRQQRKQQQSSSVKSSQKNGVIYNQPGMKSALHHKVKTLQPINRTYILKSKKEQRARRASGPSSSSSSSSAGRTWRGSSF